VSSHGKPGAWHAPQLQNPVQARSATGLPASKPHDSKTVTCPGCGHAWASSAKDGSTIRCPRCSRPRKMKRAAAAEAGPAAPPVIRDPPRPPIPGLQPPAAQRCEYCAHSGRRGPDGKNPLADWYARITFADGSESDGYACTRDVRALVAGYTGRGARIRLDPAGVVGGDN
jgi:hypothetical protein